MRTITGLEELKAAEGEVLGTSDWHEVTQKDVDTFADVTGDHQWIHVDVERAKDTPFGGTIAHGYLTLSLGPYLNNQVFKMEGFAFALNYGLNKVRFPAPVPIPSKVRASPKVKEVSDIPGGAQCVFEITFEREGTEKPVCVAESVVRVYERLRAPDGGAGGAADDHAVRAARLRPPAIAAGSGRADRADLHPAVAAPLLDGQLRAGARADHRAAQHAAERPRRAARTAAGRWRRPRRRSAPVRPRP